jgi:hypothetical protein
LVNNFPAANSPSFPAILKSAHAEAGHMGNAFHDERGRFTSSGTVDRYTGKTPRSGFAVGGAAPSARYRGRWVDPRSGKVYRDNTNVLKDKQSAIVLGFRRNQISIFDLANKTAIDTGGTGEAPRSPVAPHQGVKSVGTH